MTRNLTFCRAVLLVASSAWAAEPLPSWNDGAARTAIVAFVARVTTGGGPTSATVRTHRRVRQRRHALEEQPIYVQSSSCSTGSRRSRRRTRNGRTTSRSPALKGDVNAALAGGDRALLEMVMATHAGTTTDEFAALVKAWLATRGHPTLGRPYTELVYQPMLELLAYLRANGFTTFVVSGGGVELVRPWAEAVYGIPPEQVIGSSIKTSTRCGTASRCSSGCRMWTSSTTRTPSPSGSSGTSAVGPSQRLATRTAISRCSSGRPPAQAPGSACSCTTTTRHGKSGRPRVAVGGCRGLDEAGARGWTVASMKRDWKRVFQDPPAKR